MRSSWKFPPRTILVPLDFSNDSLAGLEAARLLGERWRCHVEVIHVDQGPPPAFNQGIDLWTTEALAAMGRDLRHWLERAAAPVAHASTHILTGPPAAIISRLAADAAADLVVLSPRRRRRLPRIFSGSLSETSVHAANAPVLTVRTRPEAGWPRRVLAPVKWAPYADRSLRAARDWAASLDAELGLLHVFEGGEEDEMERRAVVEHALNVLGEPSPRVRWHWATGRPFDEIPRAAEAGGYDLVVVAEHVRDGWKDAVFGTTAERVLRASSVPVLCVPGGPVKARAHRQADAGIARGYPGLSGV
ncbi:universal stress protein [bacterium]|nr:MAG: universal stress protein [bacterium]